jgi:hypothetical protein
LRASSAFLRGAEFLQILEFLHKFLQCELGSSGNARDLCGQEKSPRALIL